MNGPTVDVSALLDRIHRLEEDLARVNLRLDRSELARPCLSRLAGAGAFLTAVLLFVGGAAFAQRFDRLDVVGPNNDVRLSMGVDPVSGSAGLEIFGLNGRKMIFLGTSREGLPNLAMYDPTGERIVREITP